MHAYYEFVVCWPLEDLTALSIRLPNFLLTLILLSLLIFQYWMVPCYHMLPFLLVELYYTRFSFQYFSPINSERERERKR